jgi:hypothetical protein
MKAKQSTSKVLAEQAVADQPTTKRATEPLATDFADYWFDGDRFLNFFLQRNNLRNESGELDFKSYRVEIATSPDSGRPKYVIYAQPQPQPGE